MEIDTKFFISLLEKVDKEGLLKRWVSKIPNLPNNMYWEAGAPLRKITKAAFVFTCKSLELSMENNYCLNTIAVPIDDYLKSHNERLSYLTGGTDSNYEILNKIASHLGNLEQSGIMSVSPAYIMTNFVKNLRAHNNMRGIFPVDSTGIVQGGFKETLVAQMLALTHILDAMVSVPDPKTFYPGLWELSSNRYTSHMISRFIAIILIVVTLLMFIKNLPKIKATCFAMKVCNAAIRLICSIMASILIPGFIHTPQAKAAIMDVRGRMTKYIPKDIIPALKDSNGIKEATEDKCIYYKDTEDTKDTMVTTDTKDIPKVVVVRATNSKGSKTLKRTRTKVPKIIAQHNIAPKHKGCSALRKAECIKANDRCVWHVNRGCRKA